MLRSLLPLLPALALCLPASAGMIAGIELGDKNKDVLRKVASSPELAPINAKAKTRLEGTYRLNANTCGQDWIAHFLFDKRNKGLTKLIFVGNKAMAEAQYDHLLKSFYVFSTEQLRQHFKLQGPINTPSYGKASSLKEEEIYPLHAYPGDGILLTAGLWKAKRGGIHLCFTVEPAASTALGSTFTSNTSGKPEEWENIPNFTSTPEGRAFLAETGMSDSPAPSETDTAEADSTATPEESSACVETDAATDNAEATESASEPMRVTVTEASTSLPQAEQDILNALLLMEKGSNKEGLAKLIAAGKTGNARALYELGCCYADGIHGVTANKERAEAAFNKAATAGFALAMVRYGADYPTALNALGLSAADGRKLVETAQSASTSSPSARFNHAIMLRYGYGVRKDAAKALEMMQQLITEGDTAAAKLAEEWAK